MTAFWEDEPDAVPLDELRRYTRHHCKHRSQRAVAAEMRIGRTTLNLFVTGENRNPHPRVRHLMQEWYREHAGADGGASARSLAVLLDGLPADVQESAKGRLLEVVEWAHGQAGQDVPAWVATARTGGRDG